MMPMSPKLHEAIVKLVNAGKYSSIENFTEIAVRNLLTLEEAHTNQSGGIEAPQEYTYNTKNLMLEKPLMVEPLKLDQERRNRAIWGLVNRYAPAKMVLRELTSGLTARGTEWIDFKEFAEIVVRKATTMREGIQKWQKKTDLVRGEGIDTGFPQNDVRSQQRFVDLYIGRLRSNKVVGLLGSLELAVIRKNPTGNLQIGITQPGSEWAELRSPFLDGDVQSEPIAFYPDELRYLLRHVKQVRPGEYHFLNHLFKSVRSGINTPEKLMPVARTYADRKGWKNAEGKSLSDAAINSYKVGGIGRLVEMRLLRIEKDGTNSKYIAKEIADMDEITES